MPSGETPNSRKNLVSRKWRKGQSGNISGRPKSSFILERTLRERCCEVDLKDPQGRTHYEIMVDKMIAQGKAGSVRVFNEINDRLFGKAPQAIKLDGHLTPEGREEHALRILEKLGARDVGDPTVN